MQDQQTLHYPRLDTVLMVEEALKDAKEYPSKRQLWLSLKRKVMYQTFNVIIAYLEDSGKIVEKGGKIIWIWNPKLVKKYSNSKLVLKSGEARPAYLILKSIKENGKSLDLYHVKRIGLFGSYAKGQEKEGSDIDILVEFLPGYKTYNNYMDLKFFLERLLERKVDLVIKEAVKPELQKEIFKSVMYA